MRAAAILGPGNVSKAFLEFQRATNVRWTSLIEQADAIVIFGGDGTIHHQLTTLLDLDVPLLVVPCGSGNDFARALGLLKLKDSIDAWRKFANEAVNVRTIDLGVISGKSNWIVKPLLLLRSRNRTRQSNQQALERTSRLGSRPWRLCLDCHS
jgi:hypothetical protein